MLAGDPLMASLRGNLGAALAYVGHVLLFVCPLFGPVMLALAVRGVARRDVYAVVLLLVAVSFPALQVGLHDLGQSFGFARFSIYVVSLSVLGGAYLMSRLQRVRTACGAALVLGMLISAATAWLLPSQPDLRSNFEASYFRALTGQAAPNPLAARYEMGLFLRNELARRDPAARILADELATDAAIVFSGLFDNFITTRDAQFAEDLADPVGRVDYLLASTRPDDLVKVSDLAERLEVVYQTTSGEPERLTLYRVLGSH
jgi:hypothetical protein